MEQEQRDAIHFRLRCTWSITQPDHKLEYQTWLEDRYDASHETMVELMTRVIEARAYATRICGTPSEDEQVDSD